MNRDAKIFVAGGRGMVGSAIVRRLEQDGYSKVLAPSSRELDLTKESTVAEYFSDAGPEFVFLAAAKVGGINANNTLPVDFLLQNSRIQNNVIENAHRFGVSKLLFFGSSCIYPRLATQPISESSLLTGPLEPTNESYAIAKIAGIKLCEAYARQFGAKFFSVMPTNLYGPNDNFDLNSSHVLPAMLRRFHEAIARGDEQVTLWGTGKPLREFMHVDDLASASLFLMQLNENEPLINAGTGTEISIRELATQIAGIVGYRGDILFDKGMPDGTPRKLMDSSRIRDLGWQPSIELREGIKATYRWALETDFGGQLEET